MAETLPRAADAGLQGHYAGIVSRLLAFIVDVVIIGLVYAIAGRVLEYIVSALRGDTFSMSDHPLASNIALVLWVFFYSAYTLSTSGRTPGMAVFGIQAVRRDGHGLGTRRAIVRTLVFPLSFALFCFGFIMILLGRERRALHDVIAGSAVVYEWDAHAAHLRFLARKQSAAKS
jgi:uncharacterized RDD family membrane protein YckC